jgi:hypothetical protein
MDRKFLAQTCSSFQKHLPMGVDNLVVASSVVAAGSGIVLWWKYENGRSILSLPLPPGPPGNMFVGHTDLPKFQDLDTYRSWADKYG